MRGFPRRRAGAGRQGLHQLTRNPPFRFEGLPIAILDCKFCIVFEPFGNTGSDVGPRGILSLGGLFVQLGNLRRGRGPRPPSMTRATSPASWRICGFFSKKPNARSSGVLGRAFSFFESRISRIPRPSCDRPAEARSFQTLACSSSVRGTNTPAICVAPLLKGWGLVPGRPLTSRPPVPGDPGAD